MLRTNMADGKGFIINQNSDKVGEFKNASKLNKSMWTLESVKIHKDYFDLANNTTNNPFLFVLVEEVKHLGEDAFAVTDSIGVGFMYSNSASSSWASVDDVVISEASFIKNPDGEYEN